MNCFVKFEFLIEGIENKKLKPLTGHVQFLVFDFQNIEEWCLILPFLATKIEIVNFWFSIFEESNIENHDCEVLILNFQYWMKIKWTKTTRTGNVDGSYDTEIYMIMAYMYFERKGCVQRNLYSKCSSIWTGFEGLIQLWTTRPRYC